VPLNLSLQQPHIRAKILGSILIILSLSLFINPTDLNIKLAFASLLIGLFMIVMITERSIPQHLSNAQIAGNLHAVQQITKNLNLNGNAIFLPKNTLRSQERIFIPLTNETTNLPQIDDEFVFATGADGTSLGLSIPPSGLHLLNELDSEIGFEEANLDNIEEKLQTFVGHDLIKTIKLTSEQNNLILTLDSPIGNTNQTDLSKQYPSPTTSAILTAITRALQKPLRITDLNQTETTQTYHLQIQE
jgi:hypothetical protein